MSKGANNTPRRTRFARLYSDGTMGLERPGMDFLQARKLLCDGHEDDETELLEVEITVIRTHGRPHIATVTEAWVECPTCGEHVHDDEATETIAQLRRELEAAHGMLRAAGHPGAKVIDIGQKESSNVR